MKKRYIFIGLLSLILGFWFTGCASTKIIESPKTAFVSEAEEAKDPEIIWTSRTLGRKFDYLGKIEVRSWSYNGAISRLIEGGKSLKADAVVDVHYQRVGFLKTMRAFAIKFSE